MCRLPVGSKPGGDHPRNHSSRQAEGNDPLVGKRPGDGVRVPASAGVLDLSKAFHSIHFRWS